jgi:hypothetical protein
MCSPARSNSVVVIRFLLSNGVLMDLNVRAFRVVQEAIRERSPESESKKAASKKGGLIGGPSRARSISPERRVEIAQLASRARWKKK